MSTKITPTLAICIAGATVAVLALALPGGDDPTPPARGDTASPAVEIIDFSFAGTSAVAPGATIEVTNADSEAHTLTSAENDFDTGVLDGSATTTITAPSDPGTYEYFCSIHPSMAGSFRVLE